MTLTYTAPLTDIDAALDDHVAWLDANYADGTFLASGRREPRIGGVILVADINRDELDHRLSEDPFGRRGLADYAVMTFHPSRTADGLHELLGAQR
ncbi:YciI family protein [Williamsia phyllosphaerae]|uniref:YCII-related domain-containing protein n=1 Tax=Williamsia phyllosphaerae TaxID=885042 RepID=A0ABQ1V068_9NOCA|nr:YciI family protein [Williamsia phyllosphaerae]GGF29740.1 hypothetical protein GCM10007298_27110 [Williamsia phyllosphaerae]